ncbi:MAG: site-2 protease family protein [Candidatus Paracaedibacteraceae bacterium]|nr:site-2 protease family protein [Candidatus Paracaedibacteraceae bacterium]
MLSFETFSHILALVLAITLHEAAHGAIAFVFGDDTAKRAGRLTFNPIAHIDPLGTLVLPGVLYITGAPFLFGWAKPVPVDFSKLNPQRLGIILVAFAGPGMNLTLAWIAAISMHMSFENGTFLHTFLPLLFRINITLAAFNLLPILPLDGGRILAGLLPPSLAWHYSKTERFGMLVILVLMMSPSLLGLLGIHANPFVWVLKPIFEFLFKWVFVLSGNG